jgi:hypothetical protein
VADFSNRMEEPVWVPAKWPDGYNSPEYLLLVPPPGESVGASIKETGMYQLRSIKDDDQFDVTGSWRSPVRNLGGGLLLLEGERFETWTRPTGQRPHIVVCAPVWDIHVSGPVSFDVALSVARSLVEVGTSG